MYNTHNYQSGQVLTAGALNEMDSQIQANEQAVQGINDTLNGINMRTIGIDQRTIDIHNSVQNVYSYLMIDVMNKLNELSNNSGSNTGGSDMPSTSGLEAMFAELGYLVPSVLSDAAQRGIQLKNNFNPNQGWIDMSLPTFLPVGLDLSNLNYIDAQLALTWNGYDMPNYSNNEFRLSNAMGDVTIGNMGTNPLLMVFGPLVTSITFTNTIYSQNQYDGQNCLFSNCNSLQNIYGLDKIDISNHTSLSQAFSGTFNLFAISGHENWNTANITSMQGLFNGTALQSIDLSNWDFQNVQNYCGIFASTYNLHTLSLPSNFGVNAQQAQNAFQNCNLSTISIQGFNPDCGDISSMFQYSQNLQTVYLPEDFGRSSNELWGFFENCWNLQNVYGSIDVGNVSPDSWVNALFPHQDWGNGQGQYNQIRYMVVKNIGKYEDGMQRSLEIYAPYWGMEDQSCVWDSLLNYSYDRRANGMSDMTINLYSRVGLGIGEETYTALANKGYTLNYIFLNDEAQ